MWFKQLFLPFVQVNMVIPGHQDSGAQLDQTAQRTDQEEEGIMAILDLRGTKVGRLKKNLIKGNIRYPFLLSSHQDTL